MIHSLNSKQPSCGETDLYANKTTITLTLVNSNRCNKTPTTYNCLST